MNLTLFLTRQNVGQI